MLSIFFAVSTAFTISSSSSAVSGSSIVPQMQLAAASPLCGSCSTPTFGLLGNTDELGDASEPNWVGTPAAAEFFDSYRCEMCGGAEEGCSMCRAPRSPDLFLSFADESK